MRRIRTKVYTRVMPIGTLALGTSDLTNPGALMANPLYHQLEPLLIPESPSGLLHETRTALFCLTRGLGIWVKCKMVILT
jgi:hypothetical protein